MASIEVLVLIILIILLLFYKWSTATYSVLKERGVPHSKPYPLIGNSDFRVFIGKTSFLRSMINLYFRYENKKVFGFYIFRDPVILVRDIDLLKKIGVKDFDSFPNHRTPFNTNQDSILSKSLIALENFKWKQMRNILTPTFTGSKLRLMYELVHECSVDSVKYLEAKTKYGINNKLELEVKDYFTRFANDVIATVAFGLKVNSFTDKDNKFYAVGRSVLQFRGKAMIKLFLYRMMPKVMKALGIKLLDEKMINYFRSLVFDAIKYRQQKNIARPDMIHLLLEAKRNFEASKRESAGEHVDDFTDDDLLAQCLVFFIAAFDTVSTCLCYTSYELLMNPEVQQSLFKEISDMQCKLDGKPLSYEALMKMPYLEMVVAESLRKWPPGIVTDRVCSADYKLKDDEGRVLCEIKEGDQIIIPIIGIHHDPKYFADPQTFQPERFSEQNKHQVKPMTYLPFGLGSRMCIGNRLALMEVKSIIYYLLLKYQFAATEKTCTDMLNSIRGFEILPRDQFWLQLIPRGQNVTND